MANIRKMCNKSTNQGTNMLVQNIDCGEQDSDYRLQKESTQIPDNSWHCCWVSGSADRCAKYLLKLTRIQHDACSF